MLSLGFIVGVVILGIIALAGIIAIVTGAVIREWSLSLLGAGIVAFALIWSALPGVGLWPWNMQYHRWEQTDGQVREVSSRILGTSDTVTQRFVVIFEDGRERSCDDTRCALVEQGDHLTLTCKREWQYAGEDGWSCNFVRRDPAS